jgi:hypothetical protein
MVGRDAGPTRDLLMGSAGLRAGTWRISGTVGHTFCQIVDRSLVSVFLRMNTMSCSLPLSSLCASNADPANAENQDQP